MIHHDTYEHHDGEGFAFGMASGLMMLMAAVIAAAVIAGIVLMATRPWDDNNGSTTPNVPGIEQPNDNSAPSEPAQ